MANLNEQCHSWILKFRKVLRQKIWGEMVVLLHFISQFIRECTGERIIEIDPQVIVQIKLASFYGPRCIS